MHKNESIVQKVTTNQNKNLSGGAFNCANLTYLSYNQILKCLTRRREQIQQELNRRGRNKEKDPDLVDLNDKIKSNLMSQINNIDKQIKLCEKHKPTGDQSDEYKLTKAQSDDECFLERSSSDYCLIGRLVEINNCFKNIEAIYNRLLDEEECIKNKRETGENIYGDRND